MKAVLCAAVLVAVHAVGHAAETAYTALRTVGKQVGSESLNRVVEVRGRFGGPQPDVWKIVMSDRAARGGVREVEVQRSRIISDRTPVAREIGAPMNFNALNLDSDGAFTVANQEAQKARIPFDRVDYVLRSGSRGAAPLWQVELFDGRNGRVGSFDIAADSGAILRQEFEAGRAPAVTREADREFLREEADRRVADVDRTDDDRDRGAGGFFGKVKRHFEKRSRQFENFFTGRGWSNER